jgi:nicotinic acid mononucleotide adenylyltransferase/uridine phosphorylase
MRRFELFRRFSLLSLTLVGFAVSFTPSAQAVTVGFYAGTFDPPTQAELAMLRCALGDASVRKECAGIGKTIARLVVTVNPSHDDDTLASARERALMVNDALRKYRDRVEVVTAPASREEKTRALLEDKSIERLVQFIDSESYQTQKASPVAQDPRIQWLVFSLKQSGSLAPALDPKNLPANVKSFVEIEQPRGGSASAVQSAIQSGGATTGLIDPAVKTVIEKLSLYQEVSEDLAKLQRSLFEESWKGFLKNLKSACPSALSQQACAGLASKWETISITNADQINPTDQKKGSADILVYKRAQSEDRWAEKFTDTALRSLQGSTDYAKLYPVAADMSAKVFQGYPVGKVFHLRKVSIQTKRPSGEPPKVSQIPVPCSAPPGKYNMDIVQYTADRFPQAFAVFLREQFPTRSILPTDLYTHNQTVEDAYEFHRRDGFSTFYFLQTRRGQLHRNIYIAVRAKPHAYRVVFTNLRGLDQEADVYCQISHSGTFKSMHSVHAKRELPLFVFNPAGMSLKLNDKDWLLFGFKGKWERVLLEQNWRRYPLVKEGLDIDLFTHPTIKQRLVIARNVYGDDANIIMDTFYKKGVRQVVYLGTAGAIANYHVGDVVTPNEFIDNNNVSVPFQKNLAHAYHTELSSRVTVHDQTKHGRVPTLYHETLALLFNWKANSIAAMDVEGFYLAKFARNHSDLKMAAFFVISDQTLGGSTIDESEARLNLIDDSVYKLVAFLLPKVLSRN